MVGEPDDIEVEYLAFTEETLRHIERHALTAQTILEVYANTPRYFRNLPDRSGSHVMIGPDAAGRFFYVVLRPSAEPGTWRPITGWRLNRRRALRLYGTDAEKRS